MELCGSEVLVGSGHTHTHARTHMHTHTKSRCRRERGLNGIGIVLRVVCPWVSGVFSRECAMRCGGVQTGSFKRGSRVPHKSLACLVCFRGNVLRCVYQGSGSTDKCRQTASRGTARNLNVLSLSVEKRASQGFRKEWA